MSLFRLTAQLVLGIAALFVSLPATAATYLITYTGVISRGTDVTGVFYAPNTNLVGKAFTLEYTLTYPGIGNTDINTPTQLALSGGVVAGNAPSPLSAVLTINGISESYAGTREARFERVNLPTLELFNEVLQDNLVVGNLAFSKGIQTTSYGNTNLLSSVNPAAGPVAFSFAPQPWSYVAAGFNIIDVRQVTPTFQETVRYAFGDFGITSFSQRAVVNNNAVPEPATWLMMLAGFGIAGVMVRRQRKVLAAA